MADKVYVDNAEATEAWNGVLFDRFVEYRDVLVTALTSFGDDAIRNDPPETGDRVLDLGCGFGDTTRQLAQLIGPEGSALGVDVAERFIETARAEAAAEGVANVEYEVADVQEGVPEGPFDYAFARMGTMFFANPGAAMRKVRGALRTGGKLCNVVWRQKAENEWFYRSELIVDRYVERPDADDTDEPTCGPGPFSMANADTTSGILHGAGFEQITLRRLDLDVNMGSTVDRAVGMALAIGPAAETVRLAGDGAEHVRGEIERDLKALAEELLTPDGVIVPASVWVVTARAGAD
ncbi:MAG: methyltransferase domain-containing protein [Actinobacteria bacterium]|nr:methyltransferase domain-containing protein [Actinomycetota bacterium]